MRYVSILAVALVALVGISPSALAHAHLVKSQPAKGALLHVAPSALVLWFSEKLEPAFSTVEVVNQSGQRVDDGMAALDPADHTVLRVALKPLPPGSYKVVWRVVSVDTHHTNGDFAFKVAP
jgi:methionine-rich copper-binding protein CopC